MRGLRPGTTACPGALARRLGASPAEVREAAAALHARGVVAVTQRGVPADPRSLRGPYRLGWADGR